MHTCRDGTLHSAETLPSARVRPSSVQEEGAQRSLRQEVGGPRPGQELPARTGGVRALALLRGCGDRVFNGVSHRYGTQPGCVVMTLGRWAAPCQPPPGSSGQACAVLSGMGVGVAVGVIVGVSVGVAVGMGVAVGLGHDAQLLPFQEL